MNPSIKNTNSEELILIGWREWISLPELEVPGIKAKVDSGARSSALHTHDFKIYESNGETRVRFRLHPLARRTDIELECDALVTAMREVKDSGGHVEKRPFILTSVRLGEHIWPVEFSLTNRESMKFRMLLGRTAMKERFTIDPGRSYLVGKSLARCYPARRPGVSAETSESSNLDNSRIDSTERSDTA